MTEDIGSVGRLDVLLFMHRHAARWWPAEKLASEVEMPVATVQSHLEHLSARSLLDVRIAESVIFCYKPAREDLLGLVEATARAHSLQRDSVIAVLAGRPAEAARLFAQAFHFRKGKKRDG